MILPQHRTICQQKKVRTIVGIGGRSVDLAKDCVIVCGAKASKRCRIVTPHSFELNFIWWRILEFHMWHDDMSIFRKCGEDSSVGYRMGANCGLSASFARFVTAIRRQPMYSEEVIYCLKFCYVIHVSHGKRTEFPPFRDVFSSLIQRSRKSTLRTENRQQLRLLYKTHRRSSAPIFGYVCFKHRLILFEHFVRGRDL